VFRKQKTETIQKTKLKAMKTTNNVQKTENKSMKTFALVLGIVLINLTASAGILSNNQATGNESKQLMAFTTTASIAHSSEITNAATAFLFETSAEESLEIESWMTDKTYFDSQMDAYNAENDESLRVEEWMLTNQNFTETNYNTESDLTLKVEEWMLDESIWGM